MWYTIASSQTFWSLGFFTLKYYKGFPGSFEGAYLLIFTLLNIKIQV